jgi:hypothetical protein
MSWTVGLRQPIGTRNPERKSSNTFIGYSYWEKTLLILKQMRVQREGALV